MVWVPLMPTEKLGDEEVLASDAAFASIGICAVNAVPATTASVELPTLSTEPPPLAAVVRLMTSCTLAPTGAVIVRLQLRTLLAVVHSAELR
jgi:hypothetical protein